jgi:hypothetical protein
VGCACMCVQSVLKNFEPYIKTFYLENIVDDHFDVCLFCISVRNTIYAMEIEMLEPVFMARYL